MDKGISMWVGLDVHKESITIALARQGREPAQFVEEIGHDVNKLLKRLRALGDPAQIHVVYEAGPTGYGLQRKLSERGFACEIIAPSLVPQLAGSRVKTDRRDCMRLAHLSRAGELQPIWIPSVDDQAIRDLSRAREDAVEARTRARHQLRGFLLRHDMRYPGKTAWTKSYYRWLGTIKFESAAQQVAMSEYTLAVQACDERVARLSLALLHAIEGWRYEPVVKALLALRGIDSVSAIGLVAEIGDISRFDHPRKLMGYLGLVPSERSSGERINKGPITKSGNSHARRLLTEAAWSYRFKPRIGYKAQKRQEELQEGLRCTAWKAQLRLCARFAKLHARGVTVNKVCVAVARELAGFVWALAQDSTHGAVDQANQ